MIAIPMTPHAPHLCHQPSASDPSPNNVSPACDPISDPGSSQPPATSSSSSTMLSIVSPAIPGPMNSSRRPKLSLQTAALPITFGKSTTALSLSLNIPTASPTVLNTFNNAYDIPRRGSPASPSTNNITSARPRPASRLNSPYTSLTHDQPYMLPLGVRGILRNSPIPALPRRASLSAGANTRRFFPPQKRVAYRFPLEEEIKTVRFVVPHLEISSEEDARSDSDISTSSYTSSSGSSSEDETTQKQNAVEKKPKRRTKRKSHAAGLRDIRDQERQDGPGTPVQGRRKRRREWKWTLGPLSEGKFDTGEEVPEKTSPDAESWRGKTIVVDELARGTRLATPEIPLPAVTKIETRELEEGDSLEILLPAVTESETRVATPEILLPAVTESETWNLEERDSPAEESVESELEVRGVASGLEGISSPTTAQRMLLLAAWSTLLGYGEEV